MKYAALEKLIEVMPPPASPLNQSDESALELLKQSVPFPFPGDFIEFSRCYGTGIANFGCYSAFVPNVFDRNFARWIKGYVEAFHSCDPDTTLASPFAPSVDRIVPCLDSSGGENQLYLVSRGDGLVLAHIDFGYPDDHIIYPLSFTAFVLQLVTGKLVPEWGCPNDKIIGTNATFTAHDWLSAT